LVGLGFGFAVGVGVGLGVAVAVAAAVGVSVAVAVAVGVGVAVRKLQMKRASRLAPRGGYSAKVQRDAPPRSLNTRQTDALALVNVNAA